VFIVSAADGGGADDGSRRDGFPGLRADGGAERGGSERGLFPGECA